MGAADEIHVVFLEETRYNVWAECETDTSIVLAPARDVLVGIRPQQVTEETTVGNLRSLVWKRERRDRGFVE